MKTPAKNKVLNKTVVVLGLVSLFADISSEMLYPITPIFLTSVLGASMASVGLIEGFAECVASLLKTYAGRWSDRIEKRRPFVLAGYFLSAIAKPLTGFAGSWLGVFVARGVDRIGKGLRGAPRDAMLADAVAPELRGAAFGWHRAMDTIGAAIGPLLAIWYLAVYSENLRSIYYWSVIPGLIATAIILAIKDEAPKSLAGEKDLKPRPAPWRWGELSPPFRAYLIAWGVFSIANSSDVFLLMKAKQDGISFNLVIGLYCFYNLVYALASPGLGQLSDRVGRKVLLIGGLLVFAFVYAGFSRAETLWHYAFLFGVYGLYMAATDGVGKALAVDLIDPKLKATGIGVLGTVTGVAAMVSSTVAGSLWDKFGSQWTFFYGAAGSLLGAVLLLRIRTEPAN